MRPLRAAILRPGQGPEASVWPGDDDPRALHAGVLDARGTPLAVGTVVPEPAPPQAGVESARAAGAWRVRGMATAPQARGRGLGAQVLDALLGHARAHGATLVWCHARERAVPLYTRAGLRPAGPPYVLEGLGPHRLLVSDP